MKLSLLFIIGSNFKIGDKIHNKIHLTIFKILKFYGCVVDLSLSFSLMFSFSSFLSFFLLLFRATCVAYGSSPTRGQIRATAASLYHSHSNVGSKLTAMPDP